MSLRGLLTQPLTIQAMEQRDDGSGFGAQRWMPVGDPVTVKGFLRITSTTESLDDRDTVVTQRKCILPPEAPVTATSTVSFGALTWQVDGDPRPIWHPRLQRVEYIECQLVETTGG